MRKTAFILLFLSSLCYGQHISFMGITLGRDKTTVELEIKGKGFYFIDETTSGDRFKGDFWEFNDCDCYVKCDNGEKVSEISIVADGTDYLLDKLVKSMDKKYGNHRSSNDFFSYPSDLIKGYIWKAPGGYVVVDRQSIGSYVIIHVSYYDNTSINIQRAKSSNRNRSNDL